ncbi:MAG TPA: hypothetical protein DEO70_05295 [Bacteroidales bacterium]|nr:MAG: hypothetical protein A2X11_09375 [Bacteroidetes bacterium GWE2_42_24]OFY31231.1 MAG: hypothetical protein A2X09_12465 [Bacteroidetes bacterium GWF2_43_11]PKP15648.1 MAG: hypothetical protein CVU06_16160 [Bacteroidetes bacterium HGW-Bacteroidetes-22]HBZ66234.1 hypothetical protein [Bacteroidales bacterium]
MESTGTNPAHSRQIIEMLTVANEYCLFIEKTTEYTLEQLLGFLQKVAPLLYIKGALLPEIEVLNPEVDERFVTEEQWTDIFADLKTKFGDDDTFWSFDPLNFAADDARKLSMAEIFADVYQDMKDFVLLYQKNTTATQENAASSVRNLFFNHWGPRIASAMNQLHFLLYRNYKSDDLIY